MKRLHGTRKEGKMTKKSIKPMTNALTSIAIPVLQMNIGPYSVHQVASTTITRKKKIFMRELVSLCDRASQRSQRESDLYPLWDTICNAFANRADDNQAEPEVTVSVASQFTLDRPFLSARGKISYHYKIPDTLVFKSDDTRQPKVVFWVEAKRLPRVAWFTAEGRLSALQIIEETIAQQVNTQAQYVWSYFNLPGNATVHSFVVCGPYFTFLKYTGDNLSPDFFEKAHARKEAAVTRSQTAAEAGGNQDGQCMNNQAGNDDEDNDEEEESSDSNDEDADDQDEDEYEEDTTQDPGSDPLYPFGTVPHCIFEVSEVQFAEGTFELDIHAPIDKYALNSILLGAFQKILAVHTDIRDIMQNIDWFDCNYE
ncbi:hypothetical protein BT96DRAFT_978491 [Gymnopus androsaceus JB14]|uniref:Uncharacterized protein n=1 Tax=Gymnopus androsaceus JB14 TaxID=1447944 RepID=A0A6A4H9P0_9AGAR|nr:hypothetical protein BT96DRAFT_978491 [Gymnopus androsaceus JB14]